MLSNLGGALASMRQANERLEISKAMLNQHVILALIKNILGIYDFLDPAQCPSQKRAPLICACISWQLPSG